MILQFKIGTHPLIRQEVEDYPVVGDRLDLPYPTGGVYPVMITTVSLGSKLSDCIFYGEWL